MPAGSAILKTHRHRGTECTDAADPIRTIKADNDQKKQTANGSCAIKSDGMHGARLIRVLAKSARRTVEQQIAGERGGSHNPGHRPITTIVMITDGGALPRLLATRKRGAMNVLLRE